MSEGEGLCKKRIGENGLCGCSDVGGIIRNLPIQYDSIGPFVCWE